MGLAAEPDRAGGHAAPPRSVADDEPRPVMASPLKIDYPRPTFHAANFLPARLQGPHGCHREHLVQDEGLNHARLAAAIARHLRIPT